MLKCLNAKNVNFLDINLDLTTNIYKPYMKPNNRPLYVHYLSNHPRGIIQNIPKSVNKRLSKISANEDVFKSAIPPFQEALEKCGYSYTLKYEPEVHDKNKHANNRQRVKTYFNPPFSSNVKTNIGKKFLKAIDKCFPVYHPLRKIMNRNTIKISYRCMPNVKREIDKHNSKILQKPEAERTPAGCNCREQSKPCPLDGQCLTDKLVYKATVVESDDTINTYTGVTKNTFKKRYYKHASSFRNREEEHSTTLSTHIWKLLDENKNFTMKWRSIDRGKEFNPSTRKCLLCIKEKFHIIYHPAGSTLNMRSELFSTCRHRCAKLLSNS